MLLSKQTVNYHLRMNHQVQTITCIASKQMRAMIYVLCKFLAHQRVLRWSAALVDHMTIIHTGLLHVYDWIRWSLNNFKITLDKLYY